MIKTYKAVFRKSWAAVSWIAKEVKIKWIFKGLLYDHKDGLSQSYEYLFLIKLVKYFISFLYCLLIEHFFNQICFLMKEFGNDELLTSLQEGVQWRKKYF